MPWGPERFLNLALALGLSASAFAIGSAILEAKEALAYVAVWAAVAGYFFAVLGGLQTARAPRVGATLLVALAAASFLLFAAWDRLRVPYYRRPLLFHGPGAGGGRRAGRLRNLAYPMHTCTLALALTGLTLAAVAGELPARVLVHGSLHRLPGRLAEGARGDGPRPCRPVPCSSASPW